MSRETAAKFAEDMRRYKAKELRYKKPALAMMYWDGIVNELDEVVSSCGEAEWALQDDKTILDVLGGDEEEAFELRMSFQQLEDKAYRFKEALESCGCEDFDTVMVGLLGNKYHTTGFDTIEEDYFNLTEFEGGLAHRDMVEKLMRLTKEKMISTIGQCMNIAIAFMDVRHDYDYLRSAYDVLTDGNNSIRELIEKINDAYKDAEAEQFAEHREATKRFEKLLSTLPDEVWVG